MTILWLEGFESYGTTVGNIDPEVYEAVGSLGGIGAAYSRWPGMRGLLGYYPWTAYVRKDLPQYYSTLVAGQAVYINDHGATVYSLTNPMLGFYDDSANLQVGVCVQTDRTLDVRNGDGDLLASSTVKITRFEWFYLEFKAYMHATAGTVEVRLNGQVIASGTSKDTLHTSGSSSGGSKVRWSGAYGVDNWQDDLYADSANFLGDIRVHEELPDADGTHLDFTASAGNRYQCVDEDGANGDTDYVEGSGVGSQQTFGITAPTINNPIKGIMVMASMRRTEPGNAAIKTLVRQSSTDYLNSLEHDVPAGSIYFYKEGIWETDPNDSNAWTEAKLNSAEFGVEITAYTTTSTTTTTTTTT